MNDHVCPVCGSPQQQNFWHWEKEDTLVREWALDTQVLYNICRHCACIFQTPLEPPKPPLDEFTGFWDFGAASGNPAEEPVDWVNQFGNLPKKPGKALEVYYDTKRFEPLLQAQGWEVKALSLRRFMEMDESESDENLPPVEPGFVMDDALPPLEDDEQFDLVLCFDVLEKTHQPIELLSKMHRYTQPEGRLYAQVGNPAAMPRIDRTCLTGSDRIVYPFATFIYTLYKAGFVNQGAELCAKSRCICAKDQQRLDEAPASVVPSDTWGQSLYRFQRNFYWMWVLKYLQDFLQQSKNNPNHIDAVRQALSQEPLERHLIRDVCGPTFLFMHEINELKTTIPNDWAMFLHRVFHTLKYDYALFDMLRTGGMQAVGLMPEIERFFINDKMVYLTDKAFLEKYFEMQDAQDLCDSIIHAGQVVCRNLSSML